MFFFFDLSMVKEDVQHLHIQYFSGINDIHEKDIHTRTSADMQKKILGLFGWRMCEQQTKAILQNKAMQLAKISIKPIYIFRELVVYLQSQLIVLPAYYFLRDDVVGNALTSERSRLEAVLKKKITPETAELLKDLLRADNDRYELSILRKEPKDFSYTEMAWNNKCLYSTRAN